jgi:hypothetical protein
MPASASKAGLVSLVQAVRSRLLMIECSFCCMIPICAGTVDGFRSQAVTRRHTDNPARF